MNLNALLNLAANALLRNQVALGVSGHNVANVNTEGFSRQRVTFTSEDPTAAGWGQVGGGVKIESIRRQVDEFLVRQTNRESQDYSRWQTENSTLSEMEAIFSESEDFGINKSLGEFWNAWSDLANQPAGFTERKDVVSAAQKLGQAFGSRNRDLNRLRQTLDAQIQGAVGEINGITERIAELNNEIMFTETGRKVVANDLRDKRDKLMDELASYLDVEYVESPDAHGRLVFSVFLSDGKVLVSGNQHWELSADTLMSGSKYHDVIYEGPTSRDSILPVVNKGKLKAWLTLRDEEIPGILDDLDRLAASVMKRVNDLHVMGYGLDGTTGNRFFEVPPPTVTGDGGNQGQVNISGSIFDATQMTLDDYRIEFVSGSEFKVIDERTGSALVDPNGTGSDDYLWSYTSGAPIRFDGLEIRISDGTTPPMSPPLTPQAGDRFYIRSVQDAASKMEVSSEILTDTEKIAAGEAPDPGDNSMAHRINGLQNELTMKDDTLTFAQYYGELVGRVGVSKQQAQLNEDHYKAVMDQLNMLKESVSGVSLDEEMTNLLKFQYAFQAASKLLTVTDEVFGQLLDMLRR